MTFKGRIYELREDEVALLKAIAKFERPFSDYRVRPRAVYEALGIPHKRMVYLTERKWGIKGWYDYGVACDLGWLTHDGLELVEAIEMQEAT